MKKTKKILISVLVIILLLVIIFASMILLFIYSNNEYYISEKNIDIPIFVYHNIVDEITGEEYMQTRRDIFEKQIEGLQDIGYEFIRYDDLISYNKGERKLKEKTAIMTFDDGGDSNYFILFPIIKKYKIPVAINIVDDNVESPGALNWEQIKEMNESGLVDIYTHSRHHEFADKVETDQYVKDIKYAHENIEKHLNKKVTKVFTYPYGVKGEDKIQALEKEGFIQNLTDNKVNKSKRLDLSRLHREYPLNHSAPMILLKTLYRRIRYA